MNDMTKIKNPTFISAYENVAPDDYCDRMIQAFDYLEKHTDAWKGSDANGPGSRKDFSFMFDRQPFQQHIDMVRETNAVLNNGLKKYVEEFPSLEPLHYYSAMVKVQRTPPKGGFHTWHCEHNYIDHVRMLTWTIYLNDIPEGEGETEFLEYGVKIRPKKGTVCFFPAAWTHTHRGNPVYTTTKYIATGWYGYQAIE